MAPPEGFQKASSTVISTPHQAGNLQNQYWWVDQNGKVISRTWLDKISFDELMSNLLAVVLFVYVPLINSSSVSVPSEFTSICANMSLKDSNMQICVNQTKPSQLSSYHDCTNLARAIGSPEGLWPMPSNILYSDWKEGIVEIIQYWCWC